MMMAKTSPLVPPVAGKSYRTPEARFIPRTKKTAELYRLEQVRNEAIMAAAVELQKVLGLEDRFREAVPEALLNILESYDRKASYIAAATFIKRNARAGSDLESKGKRHAFGTVSQAEKFVIARFFENEPDVEIVRNAGPFVSQETAIQIAHQMNRSAGILDVDAAMIVMSSLQVWANRAEAALRKKAEVTVKAEDIR